MTPSPNSWSPASIGVENAAGSEGMQIAYDDPSFPAPNSAIMIGKTCGRSKTMFSVGKFTSNRPFTVISGSIVDSLLVFAGWCPNYCPGSLAANCPTVTLATACDYAYGDRFCQDNYGGQLASIEDQIDYDRLAALIPNDQVANQFGAVQGNGTYTCNPSAPCGRPVSADRLLVTAEKYILGLHFDAGTQGQWAGTTGQWEYTDGTARTHAIRQFLVVDRYLLTDCSRLQAADLDFLASHSQDGLVGATGSSHLVYTASYTTASAVNPGCDPATGCGLHDCCTGSIMAGFVCEFYAAAGSIGIGMSQQFDDAEAICQDEFGGHLLSIHDQATMDRLTTLTTGYTAPVLIGLSLDDAGEWQWSDGTTPHM